MKKSKILASSVAPAKRAGRGRKVLRPGSGRGARWLVGVVILFASVLVQQHSAFVLAELSVTPITWDVIGLDSNDPQTGPNQFPVGVRVCNNSATEDATDVIATFNWTEPDPHPSINLRAGTDDILQLGSVPAGECVDAYYEAEVVRDPASFDTMRNYFVKVISTSAAPASSPIRQLYVEHLISQNRNATTDVLYGTDPGGLTSVEPGGTLSMMVGGTYYIKLVGSTATQGYNQLETFINIPNTIFRILEVTTDYTADTSATVGNPNDKLYGNGCLWENDINSENLRSCLSTGKVGGGTEILYKVEILQMPGAPLINPEPIQTLYYDFSGSSYHYNAVWAASTRYIEIINASIQKSFDPKVIAPGGTSKITFTITNPGPDELTGVKFDDDSASSLPGSSSWPAGVTVASTTVGYNGCDASSSPTPSLLTVGDTSVAFDNISIAGFGTCTIELDVTVAADGTYTNTTSHLLINGSTDTESYGEDTLIVRSAPAAPTSCASPVTMAKWEFTSETLGLQTGTMNGTLGNDVDFAQASASSGSSAAIAIDGTAPTGWTPPDPWTTANRTFNGNSWGIKGGWPTESPMTTNPPTSATTYFEFSVDASNYGGLSFSADYDMQDNWSNSGRYYVLFSTDGTNWSEVNPVDAAWQKTNNEWESDDATIGRGGIYGTPVAGTGYTTVYFRVVFTGAQQNAVADVTAYLDNIEITGCPGPPEFPILEKNFLPDPICEGTPSTLQFTIANPNTDAGEDLNNLSFTDTLPAGLSVADNTGTSVCGGTLTADSVTRKITFAGGTLAPTASCTIDVEVIGAVAGTHTNTSGSISSAETGPSTAGPQVGYGQASITVDPLAITPTMNAEFAKTLLLTGETTTLTFTIENPSTTLSVSGINFLDTLPAGLSATGVVDVDDVCGTGSNFSVTGNTLELTGGVLAASGTCSFSVEIEALSSGSYAYSVPIGSNAVCDSLDEAFVAVAVQDPTSDLNILKQISTSSTGPWSNYIAVPKETDVYYRFIVENTGNQELTQVSVSDNLMTINCQWKDGDGTNLTAPFKLEVADATDNKHFAVCEGAGPMNSGTSVAKVVNTATATDSSTGESSTDTATYEVAELVLDKKLKSINGDTNALFFHAVGEIIAYDYVITNNGANLNYPITITDDKIGPITCVVGTETSGNGDSTFNTGEVNTCTATYTVTLEDMNVGSVTNVASASATPTSGGDPVTSNTDQEFVGTILASYAVISSFNAYIDSGNRVVLEWTTASEIGTIGFYLERLNEKTGQYKTVNKKLLPGMLNPPHGGTYRYIDKKARPGKVYTYRVVEVAAADSQGVISSPYTVQASELLPVNKRMFADETEGYTLAHQDFSRKQLKRFVARDKAARKL
ncbi:MAG: DUF11 domain-containing protein, partial [Candidatus Electrothrix sp. ATG1]|nr:DUF11 domain-containing protein [Candidatus Electrothrix sp. ATG1]